MTPFRLAVRRVHASVAALLMVLAGCSAEKKRAPGPGALRVPALGALREIGANEDSLELIAWPGYVERGATDPKVDWVTGFEKASGCDVTVQTASTSDEMHALMRTGQYDAVSAPGELTLRLITEGLVAPVNAELLTNYADLYDGLKGRAWNSVRGVPYGVAHGRGANLLMWRTDKVSEPADSWAAVFAPDTPYKGKITAHDSPMSIADAALYLRATRPELAIKDPYALDRTQFDAAVELLHAQRPGVREYWTDYVGELKSFTSGAVVAGTTWQSIGALARLRKLPVAFAMPEEGTTGWSDTWMVAAKARHRHCAYRWLDHIISPTVNAQAAEWFGQAPANRQACRHTSDKGFCTAYHAADEAYFGRVAFERTPVRECLDGRPPGCTDYADWAKAWAGIRR